MGRTTSANNAIASFVLQLRSPPVLSHIDSAPRNPLIIQVEKVDPVLLELLDAIANRRNDPGVSQYSVISVYTAIDALGERQYTMHQTTDQYYYLSKTACEVVEISFQRFN
jgi:hypothetical protein